MSSRYSTFNDGRYGRARTPPRYSDRRSSPNHGSSFPPRHAETGGRFAPDAFGASYYHPADRAIPRGPKSFVEGSRDASSYSGTVQGAVIPSGPKARSTVFRRAPELRHQPPLSAGRERNGDGNRFWRNPELDRPERRLSPRRRSPPPTEYRDLRDNHPSGFPDVGHSRRNSRDKRLPATSEQSMRGRIGAGEHGRGLDGEYKDWERDVRPEGRDPFRIRSRSRPRNRERDASRGVQGPVPTFDNKFDKQTDRKEEEKRVEREERSREAFRYKRDQAPAQPESRHASGTSTTSSTPYPVAASVSAHAVEDRMPHIKELTSDFRKSNSLSETAKETRKVDSFARRLDTFSERNVPQPSSPPPQAPQVPAFGSFAFNSTQPIQYMSATSNVWRAPEVRPHRQLAVNPPTAQVPKTPPLAPKAQLSNQPPTGPKADRLYERPHSINVQHRHETSLGYSSEMTGSQSAHHGIASGAPQSDMIPEPVVSATNQIDVSDRRRNSPSTTPAAQETPATSCAPMSVATKPRVPPTGPQGGSRGCHLINSRTPSRLSSQIFESSRPVTPPTSAPSGPRISGPFITSPKLSLIPTGPKADRTAVLQPRTAGPHFAGKNLQWVRPGLPAHVNRAQPPLQTRKDISMEGTDMAENDPAATGDTGVQNSVAIAVAPTTNHEVSPELSSFATGYSGDGSQRCSAQVESPTIAPRIGSDAGVSNIKNDEQNCAEKVEGPEYEAQGEAEGEDEDDFLAFDEEDLVEHEAKFEREKARLEAQKVDLSSDQLLAVPLLIELAQLRLLGECELFVQAELQEKFQTLARNTVEEVSVELLTPKAEETEDGLGDRISLRAESVMIEGTQELESLPYLDHGIPTPMSDLDAFQDCLARQEALKDSLHDLLVQQLDVAQKRDIKQRSTFAKLYSDWRREVKVLDERSVDEDGRRRLQSIEFEPPIPPQDTIPPSVPTILSDGTRRHRWGTEHDLQLAIQISLEEEEQMQSLRRHENSKQAKPDPTKEAIIPSLHPLLERTTRVFKDYNHLVQAENAFDRFELVPLKDDFSAEEHKVLVQNFREYPKKWGKLAQALPGRGYKQCINHYYATKWDKEYKPSKDRRKGKGSKARMGKAIGAQGRGRSGPLVANTGVRPDTYEGDEFTQPIVTVPDIRRPKRAAAPTFGEKESETEQAPSAASPGRKKLTRNEGSGDAAAEKPKRQRISKEKGQRRVKTQPLAAAPATSSQLMEPDDMQVIPTLSKRDGSKDQIEEARLLTQLKAEYRPRLIDRQISDQRDGYQRAGGMLSPETYLLQPQQGLPQTRGSATGGPSSYWSVPEQLDFPKLLAYYGTDWAAISNHMGSKTHTMVKNHFNRLIDKGRSSLEETANQANARRQRGDDLGPPPSLSFVPARRPDPAPIVPSRSIAPSTDTEEVLAHPIARSQHVQHNSPTQYMSSHRFTTIAQANKTTEMPFSFSQHVVSPIASLSHPQPRPAQQPNGPRLGIFTDTLYDTRRVLQPGDHVDPQEPSLPQHQIQRGNHLLSDLQLKHAANALEDHRHRHLPLIPPPGQPHSSAMQHWPLHQSVGSSGISLRPIEKPVEARAVDARFATSKDSIETLRQGLLGLRHLIDPYSEALTTASPMPGPTAQIRSTTPHHEEPRSNSVPAALSLHTAQRPERDPPRRSNIMSILNSEPEAPTEITRGNDHTSTSAMTAPVTPALEPYQRPQPPPHSRHINTHQQTGGNPNTTSQVSHPSIHRSLESISRPIIELLLRDTVSQRTSRSEWPLRMSFSAGSHTSPHLFQTSVNRGMDGGPLIEQRPISLQALGERSRHVHSPPPYLAFGHSRSSSNAQLHGQAQSTTSQTLHTRIPNQAETERRHSASQHQPQHALHPNPYAQVVPPPAASQVQQRLNLSQDHSNLDRSRVQVDSRHEQARQDSYLSKEANMRHYSINQSTDPLAVHTLAQSHQHHHRSQDGAGVLHPSHHSNGERAVDVFTRPGNQEHRDPRRPHVEDVSFPRHPQDREWRQHVEGSLYGHRGTPLAEVQHRLVAQREEELRREQHHQYQQQLQQQQGPRGIMRTPAGERMYHFDSGR